MQTLDSLQSIVRSDDAGAAFHGLEAPSWPVPDALDVDDGHLVGDWSLGFHDRSGAAGALPAFLGLADADDAAVLRFARRWGILNLCHHGIPYPHDGAFDPLHGRPLDGPPGSWCARVLNGPTFRESVETWRDYAIRARSLVHLALLIKDGRSLDTVAAREAYLGAMLGRLGIVADEHETLDTQWVRQAVTDRRTVGYSVADKVEGWLAAGRVALRLEWDGGAFRAEMRSDRLPGLFGILAAQLFRAVSGASLALCSHCAAMFQPLRQPAPGRRSYCETCRSAGVPTRDSARDAYRRKRGLTVGR